MDSMVSPNTGDLLDAERAAPPRISPGSKPEGLTVLHSEHEILFHEGDDISHYYEVVDGAVMLYKILPDGRRQVVEIVGPGGMFGISCDDTRDCSAETLVASRMRVLDHVNCSSVPEAHCRMCKQLQEQLREMRSHAVLLGRKSAMERVASFILCLVFGRHVGAEEDCDARGHKLNVRLPMTRQEIADYLGLTIETVSRSFSELKRRGLIDFDKNDWVRVTDLEGIDQLSGTR
jgi:CRP-like cAMP-binding protein